MKKLNHPRIVYATNVDKDSKELGEAIRLCIKTLKKKKPIKKGSK